MTPEAFRTDPQCPPNGPPIVGGCLTPAHGGEHSPGAIHGSHDDLRVMSFRFRSGEPPEAVLHRLLCERTKRACSRLKGSVDDSAVHEVRRELKRARSLLEWIRSGVRRRDLRHWRRGLDRCSGELSGARDAFVRLQSLSLLPVEARAGIPSRTWNGWVRHLRGESVRQTRRLGRSGRLSRARRRLEALLREFRARRPSLPEWPALGDGIRRSYQRGRRALDRVRAEPATRNRHRLRQCTQRLGDQLDLLQPTASASMAGWAWGLERLRERLGRDHDLWLLRQALRSPGAHSMPKDDRDRLLRAIRSVRREAADDAVRLGSRLFLLPTAKFFPAVDRLWWAPRGSSDAMESLDLASDSWSGRSPGGQPVSGLSPIDSDPLENPRPRGPR